MGEKLYISTATNLINKISNGNLDFKFPLENYDDGKTNLGNVRIFDYDVYTQDIICLSIAYHVYRVLVAGQEVKALEPETYNQAISSREKFKLVEAMKKEMNSLYKSKTWKLVRNPTSHNFVDCKWLYKIKEGQSHNDPLWYKVRLVTNGFT